MIELLITGGNGFVGKNFKQGYKLTKEQCDLSSPLETLTIFKELKPKKVIHTAGKIGGLWGNINAKADYYYHNIMINTNVLHTSYLMGVQKVVSMLTNCMFPHNMPLPYAEKDIHAGPPHFSNEGYAYAKRMLDIQSRMYRDQYGCNFVSIIPSNLYGEHDRFLSDKGHVIPALVKKCVDAHMQNTDFIIWGTGTPLRELLFVEDLINITNLVMDEYNDPEPLIVTSGHELSIKDIAELIASIVGFKGNIVFDKSKPDGQIKKTCSQEKFRKFFPDYKFITPEEGLTKTIDYVIKNYDNLR